MSNIALERKAVRRKALTEFTAPALPKMPHWFVRKFDLLEWETGHERWRQLLQTNIREALLTLKLDEASAETLDAQVATLVAKLAKLEQTVEDNNANLTALIDAIQDSVTSIENNFLKLSGGTMTGSLILNADPTQSLEAATKQYVDTLFNAITSYVHNQLTPADTWTINHGRSTPPSSVRVLITAGGLTQETDAQVSDGSTTQTVLKFGANFAGTARLGFY